MQCDFDDMGGGGGGGSGSGFRYSNVPSEQQFGGGGIGNGFSTLKRSELQFSRPSSPRYQEPSSFNQTQNLVLGGAAAGEEVP